MSDTTVVKPNPSNHPVNVMATLAPMILIVFFGVLAIGIPLPTLAIYVGTTLGFSSGTAGWLIGTQSIATILSRHASGSFSDRRGPKTAVILGLLLAAFAGCLYLLSTLPMLHDLVRLGILFIGRVTLGIAESLFITGALSWSITRGGAQNTVRAMSWQGISMYAALGVGAAIGLQVLQVWHFQAVAIVTIIAPLIAVVIAICVKGVPPTPGKRASFLSVIRLIWRPGLIQAFATVPYAGLSAFLALHYHSENWNGAGFGMLAFAAAYVFVRLVGSGLPNRFGASRVVAMSLAIETIGQIVLWRATNPEIALLGAALTGFGYSLIFPAMGVIATSSLPQHQRGQAVGNFIAFFDLAVGLTAPVVGFAAISFGYEVTFAIGAIASGFAFILASAGAMTSKNRASP